MVEHLNYSSLSCTKSSLKLPCKQVMLVRVQPSPLLFFKDVTMTEKEKFKVWIDKEREDHGLVHFHVSFKEGTLVTSEEIYADINRVNEGESIPFEEGIDQVELINLERS